MLSDYPKLHCPFIRKTRSVKGEWRKAGLRSPELYLVTPEVNPGYEWVFESPDTLAVEKLDGSNVKLRTEGGRLVEVQNRMNVIDPLQIGSGKTFIMEGIFRSMEKGHLKNEGEQAGELIGPKLQANPYKLDQHMWYSFERALGSLQYKSFHKYPKTFENLSKWFKDDLRSIFYMKDKKVGYTESVFAEGVIFYNFKQKEAGKPWQAKLRRDMFDWFYSERVEIL